MKDPTGIRARLREAGAKQADLAKHLGLDPSAMTRLLSGDRRLQADERDEVSAFFEGLDVDAPPKGRIAIFGYAAAGGDDRVSIATDQILEWVPPPAVGGEVQVDFGVRVAGESMIPRLFPGETVFLRRKLPPARGKDCVVEMVDGTAMVKTYAGRRDGFIFLQQYNPDRELRVAEDQVAAVHAVVFRD